MIAAADDDCFPGDSRAGVIIRRHAFSTIPESDSSSAQMPDSSPAAERKSDDTPIATTGQADGQFDSTIDISPTPQVDAVNGEPVVIESKADDDSVAGVGLPKHVKRSSFSGAIGVAGMGPAAVLHRVGGNHVPINEPGMVRCRPQMCWSVIAWVPVNAL